MKETVTVIIPNYNGKHFIEPCLSSLKNQTVHNFKILIVDNASSDGSLEFIEKNYPEIEVLSLTRNYGFSRAVNEGIQRSLTPYVLLLNNDTTVDSHFIEEMINAIQISPNIFSVSSKMIQMYHPELIDSTGDFYTILGWGFGRGKDHSSDQYTSAGFIFSACAGAAIYRREVFDRIGYFDEAHFAYLEDVDIGYRARINGYRNAYCPSALVYHVGSGTSGSKYNSFKVKLSARNSIYLNYKNMPLLQLLLNLLPLCVGYIVKYLFFAKTGFGNDYLKGIKEGFLTVRNQKKVKFRIKNLPHYIKIECELIYNTFTYFKEWFTKKSAS